MGLLEGPAEYVCAAVQDLQLDAAELGIIIILNHGKFEFICDEVSHREAVYTAGFTKKCSLSTVQNIDQELPGSSWSMFCMVLRLHFLVLLIVSTTPSGRKLV